MPTQLASLPHCRFKGRGIPFTYLIFLYRFCGSSLFSFCFIFIHLLLKICNFFTSTFLISSFFKSFLQINKTPCSLYLAPASPFQYCYTPLRQACKWAFGLQCHLVVSAQVPFPFHWYAISMMSFIFLPHYAQHN